MMRDETDPALYEISIDVLRLSDDANRQLLRTGIETVGDCVDIAKNLHKYLSPKVYNAFVNEVIAKLIEHRYLNEDESNDLLYK